MPILTKEVEIKLWGKTVKYYNDLGYRGKHGDVITVKVEDLQNGSNVKIQYLCDYCEKEVITMAYSDFTRRTKEIHKMSCKNCYTNKVKETNLLRYGVSSYVKTKECIQKMEDTTLSKYGVKHYSQTQDYKEKYHNTCVDRYGDNYRKQFIDKAFETFRNKYGYDFPSQSPIVMKKIEQSYIEHYGVSNPQLSIEIREKTENTNLKKYGWTTPLQSEEVKKKIADTCYKNGTVPTSKQQLYLFNLYKSVDDFIQLNYPISHFNVDICCTKNNLCVELDCGGHNLSVKLDQLSQKEFDRKELIRDKIIKNEGYKIIRIKSQTSKLPSSEILLQMLFDAKKYFSDYKNHSWMIYDIDKSVVFNAENKDGRLYNYGKLQIIKDSDLIKQTA